MKLEQLQQERNLFFAGPVVLFKWRLRPVPSVVYVSDNVERIFGYEPADFLSGRCSFSQFVHFTDRGDVFQKLSQLKASGMGRLEHRPFRVIGKQGHIFWVQAQTALVDSEEDDRAYFLSYLTDNTNSYEAVCAQRESEERYRQMFETNLAVKLLIDPVDGTILQANQAAIQFYGYQLEQLVQMKISDINVLSIEDVALEMKRAKTEERLFFNFRHRLSSGEIRDVEVYSGPVVTSQRRLLYSIIHDVTARKRAQQSLEASHHHLARTLAELESTQEQLIQRERVAAVGQLTSGIAHDFNNILTGILGFAEMLKMHPDMPDVMIEDIEQIILSGERAAALIRQLLDFSRKSIQEFNLLDLIRFMNEVVAFLKRTIPENIRIKLDIAPGKYLIQGDATQLQQIFTNLAVNARDAISESGEFSLKMSHTNELGEESCLLCSYPIKGDFILIEVSDTGEGISPKIAPHIFEPFFTTKSVGQGSGLGLSQVSGILVQHKGHMTVSSKLHVGTTFSLYLPPSENEKQLQIVSKMPQLIHGEKELILLVEDDPTVRKISQIMLEKLNYRVLLSANGKEALCAYHEHKHEIALVLSDMVMPEMDGVALFHALKKDNPSIKVVFMSGYPLGEQGHNILALEAAGWIQKPMSLQQFSEVLHKSLLGSSG